MVEKTTVMEWLDDMEVGHEEIEELGDLTWGLRLDGLPLTMAVVHPQTEHNHLIMQMKIDVAPQHRETLADLDEDDRDRFIYDLRITLFQLPIGTRLNIAETEPPILESMVFSYNLLEDPLQRSGFFRRIHQIQSAGLVGIQMIRKLDRFKAWED